MWLSIGAFSILRAPLIGYTIITAVILFLAAVQLLCLGIIGEYLGRVYEEVKGQAHLYLKEVSDDTPGEVLDPATSLVSGQQRPGLPSR